MKKQNVVSAIAMSLVLAAGAVGPATVLLSPQPAVAAEQTLSTEVGRPLIEARDLLNEKKFDEALAKAREADAVADKSPYESYMVAEILGSIYLQSRQYGNAAQTLERTIDSGQLAPADMAARIKLLSQLYAQVRNHGKTIEYGLRALESNPGDNATRFSVGSSQYQSNQFQAAAATMRRAIRTAQQARTRPDENWLQLLLASEHQLGNKDGVRNALQQLVRLYPSDQYWGDYVAQVEEGLTGSSTKTSLDILRFRLSSGAMEGANDYTIMAEIALQEGLPGDAQRALESGQEAGLIGTGSDASRHERLMTMASEQVSEDRASLEAGAAEAAAMEKGDADVSYGEAFWTYGQYAEAIEAIQRGIEKGVTNMDDAQLRLGMAYLGAGNRSQANAAFKQITSGTPEAQIAALWALKGSI